MRRQAYADVQKNRAAAAQRQQRVLRRVYALALAYRWTGQEKYARKAAENMLTVCAFKDWNPSHFLDTAEMSHAVGSATTGCILIWMPRRGRKSSGPDQERSRAGPRSLIARTADGRAVITTGTRSATAG